MDQLLEKTEILNNPELLPLNRLYLNKKIVRRKAQSLIEKNIDHVQNLELKDMSKYYSIKYEKYKAISAEWILQKRQYYNFYPYYCTFTVEQNKDTFIEKNLQFLTGIKHLLDCTFRYFWCYVLCESRICRSLKSFLDNAIFNYDIEYLEKDCLDLYKIICSAVYKIYHRMITARVSKTEFLEEDFLLENLRKNHYLNMKNLMVLLLLFSSTNVSDFTDKLVSFYFNKKYEKQNKNELEQFLEEIIMEFDLIEVNLCDQFEGTNSFKSYTNIELDWLEEYVSKILYFSSLLSTFFSKNCSLTDMARDSRTIDRIAPFYEKVFQRLYYYISTLKSDSTTEKVKNKIALGSSNLITVFNCFVANTINNVIKSSDETKLQQNYLDNYFTLLTSVLEYENFLKDYHIAHKIDQQLEIIEDFCTNVDVTRLEYIKHCLRNIKIQVRPPQPTKNSQIQAEVNQLLSKPSTSKLFPPAVKDMAEPSPNEDEISELVNIVLDGCPGVGSGFIMQCLERMDYDPVSVILAIKSDELPEELKNIPRDTVFIPQEKEPTIVQPVMAYRGKKPQHKDVNMLLNDKSGIKDIKDFVLKTTYGDYNIFDDDEFDDKEEDPLLNFDATEKESSTLQPGGSKFNEYASVVSDPSESSEEEEVQQGRVRDAFCENPAVVRARREAKFRAQRGGKGGGPPPTNKDLVGKPKGQGQDKNVQNNRDKKNVHKSSRANHNRKSGAQWKRNKGMVPS